MFLLDTNVVSELRKAKSNKANPHVIAWAKQQTVSDLYVSAISILEIEMGILQVERKDTHQGALLRHWLESHVLPTFAERILPIDVQVARSCAKLHVPDRRSERDALIAATAITHGMTVITRNLQDFDATGVSCINPWASG